MVVFFVNSTIQCNSIVLKEGKAAEYSAFLSRRNKMRCTNEKIQVVHPRAKIRNSSYV